MAYGRTVPRDSGNRCLPSTLERAHGPDALYSGPMTEFLEISRWAPFIRMAAAAHRGLQERRDGSG